jgi:hypothetical protein
MEMNMKSVFCSITGSILILLVFCIGANAQSKVYITPMENDFDNFLSAAMIAKKVNVVITLDESAADFIIVGTTTKGDNKWSDTIFGNEKDRNQGSVKVINPKDKTIVFATAAGDKSFWFSGIKRTGQKKVAERLADKLKDHFKNVKAGG